MARELQGCKMPTSKQENNTIIFYFVAIVLVLVTSNITASTVVPYPLPSIYPVSSTFSLEVDGTSVPVTNFIIYNEIQCHYAWVAFEDVVTIKVIANENIIQHKIRPLRHDIQPVIEGQTLKHTLSKPEFLAYNINDKEILFLLALPLETDIPDLESDSVINIMDSGIDNTGATDETEKISLAIDQAAQSDKTLYFPKGVYKMKQLEIANINGLNIYLAPGAVLRGTGKGTDFNNWSPELEPGDKKIDHFISIINSSNISIRGRGIIDPKGVEVLMSLNGGEPIHDIKNATMKIRGITTESSQNVFIDGLLIRESSSQSAPFKGCDNVSITNSMTINYLHLKNSGGFNFWGCTNGLVKNCFYYGGDDGLSAKAPEGYDCHHLTFENSVIYTLTRGVTFGMQGEEEMHSVVFRNIDAISTRDGIDFKHNYGQGDWHNILVENVTVDEIIQDKGISGNPINLQLNNGGSIQDVTIRNVVIQEPGTPGGIYGQHVAGNRPGYISNIIFKNVKVGGIPWVDLASSQLTLDAYVDTSSIFFIWDPTDVGSEDSEGSIPSNFQLYQNYPNPFNPDTHISYQLKEPSEVRLEVFNIMGEKVRMLVSSKHSAGIYSVTWDSQDDYRTQVSSGIYLLRIEVQAQTSEFYKSRKMVLMK